MGDFQPDAQVKGFEGCNLIAFIRNSFSAVSLRTFCILLPVYSDEAQK
jgi:hypothetical protein